MSDSDSLPGLEDTRSEGSYGGNDLPGLVPDESDDGMEEEANPASGVQLLQATVSPCAWGCAALHQVCAACTASACCRCTSSCMHASCTCMGDYACHVEPSNRPCTHGLHASPTAGLAGETGAFAAPSLLSGLAGFFRGTNTSSSSNNNAAAPNGQPASGPASATRSGGSGTSSSSRRSGGARGGAAAATASDPLLQRDCPVWRVPEGADNDPPPPDPDSLPDPMRMGRPPWALPGGAQLPGGGGTPMGGITFQLPRSLADALGELEQLVAFAPILAPNGMCRFRALHAGVLVLDMCLSHILQLPGHQPSCMVDLVYRIACAI